MMEFGETELQIIMASKDYKYTRVSIKNIIIQSQPKSTHKEVRIIIKSSTYKDLYLTVDYSLSDNLYKWWRENDSSQSHLK